MACSSCGQRKCCCTTVKIINKYSPKPKQGPAGKSARSASITVADNVTSVSGVKEVRFTDPNAVVTDIGGGIVEVNFTPATTQWNDLLNIPWYITGSESIKPQYTIEGNRITFRGLLFIPGLTGLGGTSVNVSDGNSYLTVPSAFIDESRVSIITNANNNNGTPQGRFMTTNILTSKNLPTDAIPIARDISFDNVMAYRRYSSGRVALYRSYVSLKIGSTMTPFKNGVTNIGSGCLMVFSPFHSEYDGSGTAPLGNDPLGLQISNATSGVAAVDYITSTDNSPFTIAASLANNPFDVNAHNIKQLGGFIINLEGLSGYLN